MVEKYAGNIPIDHIYNKVCQYASSDGSWNLQLLSSLLPIQTNDCIRAILPPKITKGDDILTWLGSHNGGFKMSILYGSIKEYDMLPHNPMHKAIWNWRGSERI